MAKLSSFRRLLSHLKPEVVHSYSFYLNIAIHCASQGTKAVVFGSTRSNFLFDWKHSSWWLARLNARWPRNQVYNSLEAAEAAWRLKSRFVPNQIFVIRNGVDLQRFQRVPPERKERVDIMGIGSLLPEKRWDRLVLASQRLKQLGFDFFVRIVGEGPLRRSLEQKVQELGVSDCVNFYGYSSDIAALLSDATFLVHSSDSEGCPNAVMEAMACGRPVVATDVGDIRYLVDDGKTGFIVQPDDDARLHQRMARLIRDFDLCQRMGEAARVKAEREFGLDRLVSQTLAAYHVGGWQEV
jgi:glycosyltransferase involved in cell wall biosynthesis